MKLLIKERNGQKTSNYRSSAGGRVNVALHNRVTSHSTKFHPPMNNRESFHQVVRRQICDFDAERVPQNHEPPRHLLRRDPLEEFQLETLFQFHSKFSRFRMVPGVHREKLRTGIKCAVSLGSFSSKFSLNHFDQRPEMLDHTMRRLRTWEARSEGTLTAIRPWIFQVKILTVSSRGERCVHECYACLLRNIVHRDRHDS